MDRLTGLDYGIILHVLHFLDCRSLAKTNQVNTTLCVLSRLLLVKTPEWTTVYDAICDEEGMEDVYGTSSQRNFLRKYVNKVYDDAKCFPNTGFLFVESQGGFQEENMTDFAALLPPRATVVCACCPGIIALDNNGNLSNEASTAPNAFETDVSYDDTEKISLSLANMPDTHRIAFHVTADDIAADPIAAAESALPCIDQDDDRGSWKVIVLLVEARSGGADAFVNALQDKYQHCAIVGGIMGGTGGSPLCIASGGEAHLHESGIVGLAISGDVVFSSQVSRACKPCSPIGRICADDFGRIDNYEDGILLNTVTVDGTTCPAATFVNSGFVNARRSMAFIGMTDNLGNGFTLHPELFFMDPGLASSTHIQVFALDATSSKEDLRLRLEAARRACVADAKKMLGALLFTCNGRGARFYGEAYVESNIFAQSVGADVGLGGFFAGGEIGPEALAALPPQSDYRRGAQMQGFTSVFGCFFIKKLMPPAGGVIRNALENRTFVF